jgi:hypothetical protein
MKSIKEKAEEYSFIGQGIDPSGIQYRDFNMNKQEGFEAGANYVLEEIEEFQKLFSTCMNSHANGYLKSVIEQLKK